MKKAEIDKLLERDKQYEIKHAKWQWKIIDWLEENIWWKAKRVWEAPFNFRREIKWFIQRGRRGYADCDWWDFDTYLSDMIPKALKAFVKEGIGYPGYKPMDTPQKWKKALKKMARGFEAHNEIGYFPRGAKLKKLQKEYKEGMELFVEHFGHLWD